MVENEVKKEGSAGLWVTILGVLIILIDGIVVLATNSLYGWSVVGAAATGWTEIMLSVLIIIIAAYYKRAPKGIGWTVFILALIAMPFDGGFWTIGAWITLIGGLMIAYRK